MAEILIKVQTYTHGDPEKDRSGVHKRGDIINIKPDGWSDHPNWAQSSYPYQREGKFILIKCPEITVEEALAWRENWRDDFAYEVLQNNPGQGRYTVRVWERNCGAAGQNNLTATKIRTYLEKWGCVDISFTTNSCRFVFSLWNAVRSEAFWERDVSNIGFTLVSYDSSTGVGRIAADCSVIIEQFVITHANDSQAEAKIKAEIERKVIERQGTVIGWDNRTLTFEMNRSVLFEAFRADVKEKAEKVYMRHRYCVPQEDVDTVIANGGIMTVSRSQILNRLRDKMTATAQPKKG